MKIIRNFVAPKESSPYNPGQSIELDAGQQGEIIMNGMGGDSFGVQKILPYAPNMEQVIVSVRLNEDLYLFRGVQLAVVHSLFTSISGLFAPFIVQKNNNVVFELHNKDAAKQTVNIQLIGYDKFALAKLQEAYNQIGAAMPVPRFLYGHATVQAGAVNNDLGVKSKSVDVDVRRMAMSSDSPDVVTASLRVYNTTIRQELFIAQLNDEFDGHYINVPFIVGANMPFDVYASNKGSQDAEVSFLCEGYASQNGQYERETEEG